MEQEIRYDIIYEIRYDIIHDMSHFMIKGWGKYHFGCNQVAKHKRKVEKQYQDPVTSQMLPTVPSMTLNIHVVEVGCIIRGHFD